MEKYLVEESFTANTYRRRYMFDNNYGVILLENIFDNMEGKKTWNAFVIQKEKYDMESGQDYIMRFDIIEESKLLNIDYIDALEVFEYVKNLPAFILEE